MKERDPKIKWCNVPFSRYKKKKKNEKKNLNNPSCKVFRTGGNTLMK
jgi:hypothetical protein